MKEHIFSQREVHLAQVKELQEEFLFLMNEGKTQSAIRIAKILVTLEDNDSI